MLDAASWALGFAVTVSLGTIRWVRAVDRGRRILGGSRWWRVL